MKAKEYVKVGYIRTTQKQVTTAELDVIYEGELTDATNGDLTFADGTYIPKHAYGVVISINKPKEVE